MLTEAGTLLRITEALDYFPDLTTEDRALIFDAIDKAPLRNSWLKAKYIDLSKGKLLRPLTLAEAVRWESTPTDIQILAGLNYAAGVLA